MCARLKMARNKYYLAEIPASEIAPTNTLNVSQYLEKSSLSCLTQSCKCSSLTRPITIAGAGQVNTFKYSVPSVIAGRVTIANANVDRGSQYFIDLNQHEMSKIVHCSSCAQLRGRLKKSMPSSITRIVYFFRRQYLQSTALSTVACCSYHYI